MVQEYIAKKLQLFFQEQLLKTITHLEEVVE